jgi:hypothetical protein
MSKIYSYPTTELGMSLTLAAAMGQLPDISIVKKFGANAEVPTTPTTIWDAGLDGPYPYLTTPTQLYIASSSTADSDTLQTGAFSVDIEGLDENYDMCDCSAVLDGQNPVQIEAGALHWRVYRAKIAAAAASTGAIGDIYIGYGTWGGGIPTNIVAKITAPNNQTLMAMYTVPRGYTAFVYEYYATAGKGKEVQVDSIVRSKDGVFRTVRKIGLLEGSFHFNNNLPFVLNEMDDIEIRGSATLGDSPVHAGFDLILRKN